MPKLTDEQREQAKKDLRDKLIVALEESPRGLTLSDIEECITQARSYLGLLECKESISS